MILRDLKTGDWFTLKPIPEPKDSQVYIRYEYDQETKKYSTGRCDDISYGRLMTGDKEVYMEFTY